MKRYIRGVGSGLPYAQQYMVDKGGSLDLEEITREVTRLSHEQGGTIPFMVIREIVENYILVIGYIEEHGSAGPTDLQEAFGKSLPTWSRELSALVDEDILKKNGRRYTLA